MASLKGSQTEQNLLTAFAGESQARNRYTYFAGAAKKEGFEQIAPSSRTRRTTRRSTRSASTSSPRAARSRSPPPFRPGSSATLSTTSRRPPPASRWNGRPSTPSSPASPPKRASPRSPTPSADRDVETEHETRYALADPSTRAKSLPRRASSGAAATAAASWRPTRRRCARPASTPRRTSSPSPRTTSP